MIKGFVAAFLIGSSHSHFASRRRCYDFVMAYPGKVDNFLMDASQ
jgi:hypothetical protein